MSVSTSNTSPVLPVSTGVVLSPTAFYRDEEIAAGRYLTARTALVRVAGRVASVAQLVREQPHRRDYRRCWQDLAGAHADAVARCDAAYRAYRAAQVRTDLAWTATTAHTATTVPARTTAFCGH